MVWTIAPAVSGGERRRVLAIHVAGLLAGALTMCLVLVLLAAGVNGLQWTTPSWLHAVTAIVLLAWIVRAVSHRGLPYPRSRWQVPESWRARLPLKATAGGYGYLLGLGPLTDVVLPTYWLLVGVTVFAIDSVGWALVGWLAYGATRAVVTVAGIHYFSSTCSLDGTPASSAIRPSSERMLVMALTVLLFITVASFQLAPLISR